jgi:hypothetical protein
MASSIGCIEHGSLTHGAIATTAVIAAAQMSLTGVIDLIAARIRGEGGRGEGGAASHNSCSPSLLLARVAAVWRISQTGRAWPCICRYFKFPCLACLPSLPNSPPRLMSSPILPQLLSLLQGTVQTGQACLQSNGVCAMEWTGVGSWRGVR